VRAVITVIWTWYPTDDVGGNRIEVWTSFDGGQNAQEPLLSVGGPAYVGRVHAQRYFAEAVVRARAAFSGTIDESDTGWRKIAYSDGRRRYIRTVRLTEPIG
jgi:hypothetical protein